METYTRDSDGKKLKNHIVEANKLVSDWYQPQERAMAPGIAGEWPLIIKKPKCNNGRLVKKNTPHSETINLFLAECEKEARRQSWDYYVVPLSVIQYIAARLKGEGK